MSANKRQQGMRSAAASGPGAAVAHESSGVEALRDEYLARLNAIAARVQEMSMQISADLMRSVSEAQMGAQMRQQALVMDYATKAQKAAAGDGVPMDLNALSQRCGDDLQLAHAEARKSVEEQQEKLRGALATGIEAANREWDAACLGFVDALRQRLARTEPQMNDPAELATIGHALGWVASMMRPRAST